MSEKWEEQLKTIWKNINKRPFKMNETKKYLEDYKGWQNKIKERIISDEEYYKPGKKNNLVYFISNDDYIGGIRFPKINWLYGGENDLNASGLDKHLKTNTDYKKYLELIQRCLNEKNSEEFDKIINDKSYKYSAQNFLRKLIIVDQYSQGIYDYLAIFSNDTLDFLYTEIFGEKYKKEEFFEINKKIFDKVKKVCPNSSNMDDLEYNLKLMWALWQMATVEEKDFPTDDQPNVIFYGAPGTGKTYLVKNMIDLVCQGNTSRYEWVQFHPSYTYEDFIEGIKPTGITENGSVKLELVNGIFKELCIRAKNDPEHKYYFIADEINRANLSAVFGEVLSCIEPSYRDTNENHNLIKTQYSTIESKIINEQLKTAKDDEEKKQIKKKVYFCDDKKEETDDKTKEIIETKFGIPSNVYFIGMMNDVDKSIDSFDLALRRRFKWIRKDCDYEVIEDYLSQIEFEIDNNTFSKFDDITIRNYKESIKDLNNYISETLGLGTSYEFGHSFFMNNIKNICNKKKKSERNTINIKDKNELFEKYLKPTLTEYLRSICESEKDLEDKLKKAKEIFTKPFDQKYLESKFYEKGFNEKTIKSIISFIQKCNKFMPKELKSEEYNNDFFLDKILELAADKKEFTSEIQKNLISIFEEKLKETINDPEEVKSKIYSFKEKVISKKSEKISE